MDNPGDPEPSGVGTVPELQTTFCTPYTLPRRRKERSLVSVRDVVLVCHGSTPDDVPRAALDGDADGVAGVTVGDTHRAPARTTRPPGLSSVPLSPPTPSVSGLRDEGKTESPLDRGPLRRELSEGHYTPICRGEGVTSFECPPFREDVHMFVVHHRMDSGLCSIIL